MQNLIATTFEVVHYIALQAVHYKPLQEVHLSRYNQIIDIRSRPIELVKNILVIKYAIITIKVIDQINACSFIIVNCNDKSF